MFVLRFYNVLLNWMNQLLDTSVTPVLPTVTAESIEIDSPPRKRKYTRIRRKPSDTTKFTEEQRQKIWVRYQSHLQYNKAYPVTPITFQQFTDDLNFHFGTNKSKSAFMLIVKEMGRKQAPQSSRETLEYI